jgi:hypothetical protein
MNAYSAHYERFKGKAKKGGSSRGGPKVPRKTGAEKPVVVPPPSKPVIDEVPTPDLPTSPPPATIPVSDFVDLRDHDEEEQDEEPIVFRRKRKTVEEDVEVDSQAQAKRAKKGKEKGKRHIPISVLLGSYLFLTFLS